MRPHATVRPQLTSNTSHTPPPSPSRFHSLSPASHLLAQPTRITVHRRRRRGEKATAEAGQSTVFAGVGGARRSGAASPERVRVEGNARFIYRIPSLILFPSFLPVRFLDPFLEIPAIRRCAGVPAAAAVRHSCVPAVASWEWAVSSPPLRRHRR